MNNTNNTNNTNNSMDSDSENDIVAWIIILGVVILGLMFIWGIFSTISTLWKVFVALDKTIAAAFVAGFFTVVATTITVMVARYYEEKRKKAELHREKKIEMYDEFITMMFDTFAGEEYKKKMKTLGKKRKEVDLLIFLKEKQKQIMLWSNAKVVRTFAEWQRMLQQEEPNAQSLIRTEELFLAIRTDLGHSNWGIKRGDTIRNLLNNTDFFLEVIKTRPNISLADLSEMEDAENMKNA